MDAQLETFLQSCRSGKQPKAGLEAGLVVAAAVILASPAMDGAQVRMRAETNYGHRAACGYPGFCRSSRGSPRRPPEKIRTMKEIAGYTNSGRPIVALRTSTHAFNHQKRKDSP